jgi:hypothetical protein
VLTLVKFSLTGKLAKTMTPPVISHLALFLEFLRNDNTFHSLKITIWDNLNYLLIGNGLNEEIIFDNILSQLQVHLIVLNHLKNPEVKKRKNLRVKFEETEEVLCPVKQLFNDDYKNDLIDFINVVLKFYLNKTSCFEVGHLYANHVCQVLLIYKDYGIHSKLAQILPITDDEKLSPPFRLYVSYVKTWIDNDRILTYNSISLIIGLLEIIINEEERSIMINDLNQVIIIYIREKICSFSF